MDFKNKFENSQKQLEKLGAAHKTTLCEIVENFRRTERQKFDLLRENEKLKAEMENLK